MNTQNTNTAYLVSNSVTGGYWTGQPAPNSFSGSVETAQPVSSSELVVLRHTYSNVQYEVVEMQDA